MTPLNSEAKTRPAFYRETHLSRIEQVIFTLIFAFWIFTISNLTRNDTEQLKSVNTKEFSELNTEKFSSPVSQTLGIYRQNLRVGQIELKTDNLANGEKTISTRTTAALKLISKIPLGFDCHTFIKLDKSGGLTHLNLSLRVKNRPQLSLDIEGMRLQERLHIIVKNKGNILYRNSIALANAQSFATGLIPLGQMPKLALNKSWIIKYFNPLSRKTEPGTAHVTALEKITVNGKVWNCFRIEIHFPGNNYLKPVLHVNPNRELMQVSGLGDYYLKVEKTREIFDD